MTDQALGKEKVSLLGNLVSILLAVGGKLLLALLAGALSMFFAEALSGSSVLWFATPWAWLVTFWLYLAHILLFVNLALIFRRTSLTALYLWGVLFGLYESWITKVTWAGYAGSAPGWGTFLGFALPEFPLIVFFWHPVFSFILPVLCFEMLSGKNNILPGHRHYLKRTKTGYALALTFVLIGALLLSTNAKGNVAAVVLTIVGSVALIGIFYLAARRILKLSLEKFPLESTHPGKIGGILLSLTNLKPVGRPFSIESLRLGRVGMALLLAYLAILYALAFFFLLPGRIAPPLTILLTLGVYIAIILLLYLKKPDEAVAPEANAEKRLFGLADLAILLALLVLLGAFLSLITPVDFPLVMVVYLAMILAGPVLLLLATVNIVKAARKKMATSV